MLNENIKPSTINGIKRLAKQLKKAHYISHSEALDLAAQKASFENFAHARNRLQSPSHFKSSHQLFFSVFWRDLEQKSTGREVLEIELSTPLLNIATKREFKRARALGDFRLALPDHFVNDHISHSQEMAQELICKAVRTLRFMEATGLKPSKDFEAAYPNRDYNNRLPKSDHATDWFDPKAGQFILIDEPYLEPVVDGERAEWARKHNWHLEVSAWPGMYYPGMSNMFVSTDASTGYDIRSLMAKIDDIPTPATQERWTGTSNKGHAIFFSPLCITPQDKRKTTATGTMFRMPGNKTVPLRSWDAPENERRPNAVMSIESHLQAARIINAVEHSDAKPRAVNRRLISIKGRLEDWFFAEHEREVTDKFDLFYYGGIDRNDSLVLKASSSKGVISLLQELKDLLSDEYIDCKPLRSMIGKLDTSISMTTRLL